MSACENTSFCWDAIVENLPLLLKGNFPEEWGGLLLNFIFTIVAVLGGLFLGTWLAIARRSSLPAFKWISTIYIEVIRGVPLVTILFVSHYLFPLFLPPDFPKPHALLRAQLAFVFFGAAYFAEVVRGGLQSIHHGQWEAATALGLSYTKKLRFIILPQAYRVALPNIASTCIGLFKDTSLVAIIGIFDLLGTARNIPTNPEWLGKDFELLLFSAVVFWLIGISFSVYLDKRKAAAYG